MIASGPARARLRIGTSICAQGELKGPIIATRSSAAAYAFALAAQRRFSQFPDCAVELSHDR